MSMPMPILTGPLLSVLGDFAWMPWVAVAMFVVLAVALFSIAPLRARAYRKKATLSESTREQWRARVVAFVRDNSPRKGDHVSLAALWKGTGLTAADRFVILEPLRKSRILSAAYSSDGATNLFQTLLWGIPGRPPRYVELSERDWTQMASGAKARQVIKKQIINKQITKTTLGDVTGSAVAIGAHSRADNRVRQLEVLSAESAARLVAALRGDAVSLPEEAAEEAESAADALELDVRAGRAESALRRVNSLLDLATKGAELGSRTGAVLHSFGALG